MRSTEDGKNTCDYVQDALQRICHMNRRKGPYVLPQERREKMNELIKKEKEEELLRVIKGSIGDARNTLQELAHVFKNDVQMLRVEESENVFLRLMQNIRDLQCVMDFMGELKEGLSFFKGFNLPSDPITHQDNGVKLFREMNSAFETKDWIMLSDLIEYELSPLLMREDEWFALLDEKLAECAA